MNETPMIASATCAVATLIAAAIWLDRHRGLTLPSIGVFDWSDVVFLAGVVLVFPLLQYVEPRWLAEATTTLMIVASTADLARGALRGHRVAVGIATWSAGLLCAALAIASGGSVTGRILVADMLLIPVVWVAALAWTQVGMRLAHLSVVLVFLTAYDLAATPFAHFMGPLTRRLAEEQPPLVFALPTTHGTALLGVGDVLIAVLVPLVLRREFGVATGRIAAAFCTVAYAAGLVIAASRPGVTIPLMVTLAPAALLAMLCGRICAERSPAPDQLVYAEMPRQ